ncbi:MAG: isoprenylcysteine carboxylmethyltransferase family protein [Anaerolineaceae bacterium]|jgi:protein-S-isoprenylcysteine O-methyltransferase Ste14
MGLYVLLISIISFVWFSFEVGLMVRDAVRGKGKTTNDKGTRYFNFIALAIGFTAAGYLNGIPAFFFPGGRTPFVFFIGMAIMLSGIALRFLAIAALGSSFRTTVETDNQQKVISSGPYRLIRHPSYSGLLLICGGYGVALQNWLSLLAAVLIPLAALLYRISIEEKALAASLGPDYVDYQKRTKKLIPWVW